MSTNPLSHKWKVSARTSPALFEKLSDLMTALKTENVLKFRTRKVGNEAIINALLIDFLDWPYEEQKAFLERNIRRFEDLLLGDDEAEDVSPAEATGSTPTDPPRPPRGRKKA